MGQLDRAHLNDSLEVELRELLSLGAAPDAHDPCVGEGRNSREELVERVVSVACTSEEGKVIDHGNSTTSAHRLTNHEDGAVR